MVRGNGNQHRGNGLGTFLNGRFIRDILAAKGPAGIQSSTPDVFVQNRNPDTAGIGSIPAGKGIAFLGRHNPGRFLQIGIKALHIRLAAAAIHFVNHIAVIFGKGAAVFTVDIHIVFHQTTLDQRNQNFSAGVTPLAHGKHEVASGFSGHQDIPEGSVTEHPGLAHVVCKKKNSIELILLEAHFVFVIEAVDHFLKGPQFLTKKQLRFIFGDAIPQQAIKVFIRALGSVAHGPLLVVPAGIAVESFHLL